MKTTFFILSLSLTGAGAIAQIPATQWARSFGGSSIEAARSVCQTSDGGYIAAGSTISTDGQITGSHGAADMWVTKISATGALQWEKCLGGSLAESANCILQTTDGNYVVAGRSISTDGDVTGNHGGADMWVVKIDTTGSVIWQKSLGGSADEECTAMEQTSDGGFILVGGSTSNDGDVSGHKGPGGTFQPTDAWVVKINDTGGIQWENSFGGSSDDYASAVQQTSDGGYIVACSTASTDGDISGGGLVGYIGYIIEYNYWVFKLSPTGALQWHEVYGGDNSSEPSGIIQTMDGGYIINGYSKAIDVHGHHGLDDNSDIWLVKTDDSGRVQWTKALGTYLDDYGANIVQTADSGYMVFGYIDALSGPSGDVTSTRGGGDDYWLARVTSTGTLLWGKTFGGSSDDAGYAMNTTADGGYILAGGSQSNDGDVTGNHGTQDFWIVKLGCVPVTATVTRVGNTFTASAYGTTYQWTLNGTPIPGATNATYTALTNGSYAVITTAGDCSATSESFAVINLSVNPLYNTAAINIFPNPGDGNISVSGISAPSIKIYNLSGQIIKEEKNTNNISIAEFPPGIYFIDIFNEQGDVLKHGKIIKR